MSLQTSGQVQKGVFPNVASGTSSQPFTQGQFGESMVSELNGRYANLALASQLFSAVTAGGGVQLAATHLFSTAIGTFTPILAVYNPLTSTKNLVVLSAWCALTAAPLATATQTGGFLFVVQSGQSITNAQTATPVNHFTFKATGSIATGITNATLTGAVGNPILLRPMATEFELVTATANASAVSGTMNTDPIDGAIIIPPGGYLGIANGISNAVAGHLVTAGITWAELPQ